MSVNRTFYERLEQAITQALKLQDVPDPTLSQSEDLLLLTSRADIAGFVLVNGDARAAYEKTYAHFRELYRANRKQWDQATLSFVLCRQTEDPSQDAFFTSVTVDPYFCRKYVIRFPEDADPLARELSRLPFLPLPVLDDSTPVRPVPAQTLLRAANVPADLARDIVEPRRRAAKRIVEDLMADSASTLDVSNRVSAAAASAIDQATSKTRLQSITLSAFRAYRDERTFDLDAPIVVLYGPNGLGKTSLFDAIDYSCTGKIGRLCRQRRGPEEFARIVTHLDKGAAQGETSLTYLTDGATVPTTIRRSVVDSNAAWHGGNKMDRKQLLTELTQATADSTLIKNLEALFRATHLFGQDDQELLLQFREQSVIPAELVTRMLALDDYASASSKAEEVAKQAKKLAADLRRVATEANETVAEQVSRLADLDAIASDVSERPIAQLATAMAERLRGLFSGVGGAVGEELSPGLIQGWISTLEQDVSQTELRLKRLAELTSRLGVFTTVTTAHASAKQELESAASKVSLLEEDLRRLQAAASAQAQIVAETEKDLADTVTLQGSLEGCVRTLDQVTSARTALGDQQASIDELTKSLEANGVALRANEEERVRFETELSQVTAAIVTTKNRIAGLRRLLEVLPDWRASASAEVDLRKKLGEISAAISEARESVEAETSRETTAVAEARGLETEYERLTTDDAALTKLLDQIETFIQSEECPTCGKRFKDRSALNQAIDRQKNSRSAVVSGAVAKLQAARKDLEAIRLSLQEQTRLASSLGDEHKRRSELLNLTTQRLSDFAATATKLGFDATALETDAVAKAIAAEEEGLRGLDSSEAEKRSLLAEVSRRSTELTAAASQLTGQITNARESLDANRRELATIESKLVEQSKLLSQDPTDRRGCEAAIKELLQTRSELEIKLRDEKIEVSRSSESLDHTKASFKRCFLVNRVWRMSCIV